jgi:hypothetical protein
MKNKLKFLFSLGLVASLCQADPIQARIFDKSVVNTAFEEQEIIVKGKKLDSRNNPFKADLLLENNQDYNLVTRVDKRQGRPNRVFITMPKVNGDVKGVLRLSGGNVPESSAQVFPIEINDDFTAPVSNNNDPDAIPGNSGSSSVVTLQDLSNIETRLTALENGNTGGGNNGGSTSGEFTKAQYDALVNSTQANANNLQTTSTTVQNLTNNLSNLDTVVNGANGGLVNEVNDLKTDVTDLNTKVDALENKSNYVTLRAAGLSSRINITSNPNSLPGFIARHMNDEKVAPVAGFVEIPSKLPVVQGSGTSAGQQPWAELVLGDTTACYQAKAGGGNKDYLYDRIIVTGSAGCDSNGGNGGTPTTVSNNKAEVAKGDDIKLIIKGVSKVDRLTVVELPYLFIEKVNSTFTP